ncbi:MAG: hypothetical protein IPL73_06670 [Candidatus Obscuribacter sp.]|nr:hypothetical protein [Candidatus Obscuribacter sp.]
MASIASKSHATTVLAAIFTGTEGKMLDQMQAQYQSVVAKQPHTKENKQARTIVPEGQDAGNKSYQLWQGEISCKQISIGQNLVFTVSRVPLGPLYVVDNAGVGALYF